MNLYPDIVVSNLCFSYEIDKILVLDKISLNINRGEFISIIGPNGSGKSTLLKHFNCILSPNSGDVIVYGMNTKDEEFKLDIVHNVGMVFQNPDNQMVASIVEEDIAFTLENLGVPQIEMQPRINSALEKVGMLEYASHTTYGLSAGQKQKVAIAGILAMMPKCILLDEPTSMLDPVSRQEVLKVVKSLNRVGGVTVIMVTHRIDETIDSDRILVLNDKKIVLDGTPYKVFSSSEYESLGLDLPSVLNMCKKYNVPETLDVTQLIDQIMAK